MFHCFCDTSTILHRPRARKPARHAAMKLLSLLSVLLLSLSACSALQPEASRQGLSSRQLQTLGTSFSRVLLQALDSTSTDTSSSSSVEVTQVTADSSLISTQPGALSDQQADSSINSSTGTIDGDDTSRLRLSSGSGSSSSSSASGSSKSQQQRQKQPPVEFVGPIVRVHTASIKAKGSRHTGFEYLTESLDESFEESQKEQQLEQQQGSSEGYPWSSYINKNDISKDFRPVPDPYSVDISYRQHPPTTYEDIPPGEPPARYLPSSGDQGEDGEPYISRHPVPHPEPEQSGVQPDSAYEGPSSGAPTIPVNNSAREPYPKNPPPPHIPDPYSGPQPPHPPQQQQQQEGPGPYAGGPFPAGPNSQQQPGMYSSGPPQPTGPEGPYSQQRGPISPTIPTKPSLPSPQDGPPKPPHPQGPYGMPEGPTKQPGQTPSYPTPAWASKPGPQYPTPGKLDMPYQQQQGGPYPAKPGPPPHQLPGPYAPHDGIPRNPYKGPAHVGPNQQTQQPQPPQQHPQPPYQPDQQGVPYPGDGPRQYPDMQRNGPAYQEQQRQYEDRQREQQQREQDAYQRDSSGPEFHPKDEIDAPWQPPFNGPPPHRPGRLDSQDADDDSGDEGDDQLPEPRPDVDEYRPRLDEGSGDGYEPDSSDGICLKQVETADCRLAGADGTQQFTSKLGCCGSYADTFKRPGTAHSVARTASYSKGKGLYPRAGHTECVWITHPLDDVIHINRHVKQIGYATGTCYFGDAINACGGPFIDGLTITVQAEVYETYALSKQPPKPRNGYNSCRDLNLQRRLPYSTQPPHTSDGNPPYGGMSEGVHRATAGPMPHSALALPAPGGSMVSDMINSRNPQLPHSSGIGMFSPHNANTPPHSPGMSSAHGAVHSHLGHNSHRAMEAPEDWSKPQPDSAPGNSTLATPPPPTPYNNTPRQHQDETPPQTAGPTSPATPKPSSSMGFLGSSTPHPAAGGSNPQRNPPPQGKTLDKTLDNTLASPKVPSEPPKASLPATNSPNALPTPGTSSSSAATGPAAAPPQQQQQPQAAAVQPAQTRPQPTLQDGLAAGSKDRTLATGDNHVQAHGGSTLADPAPMGDSAEGIYGHGQGQGLHAPRPAHPDRTLAGPAPGSGIGVGVGGAGFFSQPAAKPPTASQPMQQGRSSDPHGRTLDTPGASTGSTPVRQVGLNGLGGIGGPQSAPSRVPQSRTLDAPMPPWSAPTAPQYSSRTLDGPAPAPAPRHPGSLESRTLDGPRPAPRQMPPGGRPKPGMGRPPPHQPHQSQQNLQRARNAQDRAQQVLDNMLDPSEEPVSLHSFTAPGDLRMQPQPQHSGKLQSTRDRSAGTMADGAPPTGAPRRRAPSPPPSTSSQEPELSSDYKTLSPEGMAAIRAALNNARQTLDELQRQSAAAGVDEAPAAAEPAPRRAARPAATRPPPSKRMDRGSAMADFAEARPKAAPSSKGTDSIGMNIGGITKDFFSRGSASSLFEKGSRALLSLDRVALGAAGAAAEPVAQVSAQLMPLPQPGQTPAASTDEVSSPAASAVRVVQQTDDAPVPAPTAPVAVQAAETPTPAPAVRVVQQTVDDALFTPAVRVVPQTPETPLPAPAVLVVQPAADAAVSTAAVQQVVEQAAEATLPKPVRMVQQTADGATAQIASLDLGNNAQPAAKPGATAAGFAAQFVAQRAAYTPATAATTAASAQPATSPTGPEVQQPTTVRPASPANQANGVPTFKAQLLSSTAAGTTVALSAQLVETDAAMDASDADAAAANGVKASVTSLWPGGFDSKPAIGSTARPPRAGQRTPSGTAASSASERPSLWEGKAIVLSGQITSVVGPRQDFKFEGGVVEYVAQFHGQPLIGPAAAAALSSDAPYVKDKVYNWVFDEGTEQYV